MANGYYFSSEYQGDAPDNGNDGNISSIMGFVYGREGNRIPSVTETIKHCKKNKISKILLTYPDIEVLTGLSNSQLEVSMWIPNWDLQSLATNPSNANKWVKKHISPYLQCIKFKYISIGNEPLGTPYSAHLFPAMLNIHAAIQAVLLTEDMDIIKVTTTVCLSHLQSWDPSNPPSTWSFNENLREDLIPILQFLKSNETPLFACILPIRLRIRYPHHPPLSHYLFNCTNSLMTDGKYKYINVFDNIVDGFYSAMEALNMYNVKIAVLTGWPHSGGWDSSVINAKTYHCNLARHVQEGTPKRPGPLETYIRSMYDENYSSGSVRNKNYGVFNNDGKAFCFS